MEHKMERNLRKW